MRRPPGLFAGFLSATAFFTRLPVDPHTVGMWRLAESAWAFPFVGAGIGGIAALALLMAQLIGLGTWPAALMSVVASIVLTGALIFGDHTRLPAKRFFMFRSEREYSAL